MRSFRFNDPVFAVLERVATPQFAVGLAVLAGFLVAIWLRSKATAWSPDTFAWPMAASLLCAPVVYPWYLLWLLPFVALGFVGPDHHLDSEHHPNLLRLAFAHA